MQVFLLPKFLTPSELNFKRSRQNKNVIFKAADGCTLLQDDNDADVSKISIIGNGSRVRLPASYKKKNLRFPTRYKFFACGVVNDELGLYAKKKKNSIPVEIEISFSQFADKTW